MNELDNVAIAAPCPVSWESMSGDERVRHCSQCSKSVYNLSAMNAREAEQFLQLHKADQCLRFFRRSDGKIMTDDCPIGLRFIRNKCRFVAKIAAGLLASLVALAPGARGQSSSTATDSSFNGRPTHGTAKGQGSDTSVRAFVPSGWPFDNGSGSGAKKQIILGNDDSCSSITPVKAHAIGATIGEPMMMMGKRLPPHSNEAPPAVAGNNIDPFAENTPSFNLPAQPNRDTSHIESAADGRALALYNRARIAESSYNPFLAITLLKNALKACDSQTNADPKFREMIETDLRAVQSKLGGAGFYDREESGSFNDINAHSK